MLSICTGYKFCRLVQGTEILAKSMLESGAIAFFFLTENFLYILNGKRNAGRILNLK